MRGKVAILVEEGYEDLELWYPYLRLTEAGFEPVLIGTGKECYHSKHGYEARPDADMHDTDTAMFEGLIIPGGQAPDRLRTYPEMVEIVRRMFDQGKLVASICHGGSMLASANVLRGRRVTSFHSIEIDMINAGALYLDEEVVVDGNLITSRTPKDLPAFMREILRFLGNR